MLKVKARSRHAFILKQKNSFRPPHFKTKEFLSTPGRAPGRTRKNGSWLMDPPPPPSRVLDRLQYFETILPLEESLCSYHQDEVYFMGGGAG